MMLIQPVKAGANCARKKSMPPLVPLLPLSGSSVAEQIEQLPLKNWVTTVQKRLTSSHYRQLVALVAVVAYKNFPQFGTRVFDSSSALASTHGSQGFTNSRPYPIGDKALIEERKTQ